MPEGILEWLRAHPVIKQALLICGILTLSSATYFITKKYILKGIGILVKRSKTEVDDIIFDRIMSRRLAMIVPILIIYNFSYLTPAFNEAIQRVAYALIFMILLTTFTAFLNALNTIYKKKPEYDGRPIKGYIQAVIIVAYILGILVMIGILTGQSLWMLLSGVGALTAVLLLVFRDTILAIVASLEITTYDLVRLGDWIEVPAYKADGDVIDIALHTIKIQNFDKTITVIPTHKLIDASFKNWRGMQESGGRRIKRSMYIDISSIRLCDRDMLERFEKIDILKSYMDRKKEEISADNREKRFDMTASLVNGRRLTNIGTFRAYMETYLGNHEEIHDTMTFLVRQLAPGPTGLPIEIYVFSKDTRWTNYEAIQADIFDHFFAVLTEFDLRAFQYPAGNDLYKLVSSAGGGDKK